MWLTRILTEGLQVSPSSVSVEFAALENYPSAVLLQPQLEAYLEEDLKLGHLAKVHVSEVASPLRVHPIALIPKSGQPGKFRLITDISSPNGKSVNDRVPEPPKFRMVSIRDVFLRVCRNSWGGKIDVAHAFRNIPLAKLFAGHLAFRVGDFFYFELRLPFGFTWSPFVWNSFSDFIQRYCAVRGINCVVYCDDFLILGKNKRECFRNMRFLLDLLDLLGIPVKPSKIVWPCQKIEFLGLWLDFRSLQVSASPERITSILGLLEEVLSRKSVLFRKLEKLVGKLSFVSQIISGGRTFLRRIYDSYPKSRCGKVVITPAIRADLLWWKRFLPIWNGNAYMHPSFARPRFSFTSDASNIACAGSSVDSVISHIWSPKQVNWHINIKELWSVYHCLRCWSHKLRGATVIVGVDNSTAVAWINNGTARSPIAMKILRKIFWIRAKFDIQLFASWISTDVNTVADAASRLDFARVHKYSGIPVPWSSVRNFSPGHIPFSTSFLSSDSTNSLEFRTLLNVLKTSSLPNQERSYWPLMQDPRNVLELPHGKLLFGFALPMGMTHEDLRNNYLSGTPRGSTSNPMPTQQFPRISQHSLRFLPPWVFRLISRDWNAPRCFYLNREYVASLLRQEDPKKELPSECYKNSEIPWMSEIPSISHSGVQSLSDFSLSCVLPTSCQNPRRAVMDFYTSDAEISNSRMMERSSKSDVRKLISTEKGKSLFPFLVSPKKIFAPCLPYAPSSKLSKLSLHSLLFPSDISSGSATETF